MVDEMEVDTEIKEKFIPLPIELEEEIDNQKDVLVILLMVDNPAFNCDEKVYNLKLCGKSMLDWIELAIMGRDIKKVECGPNDELIYLIKPLLEKQYKYTAVIYTDTPLLKKETFDEIINFVKIKKLSVTKLTRGYVFETKTLENLEKLYNPQTYYFDEEDFITAYNFKQLAMMNEIMKNRILNYHMKNGVMIIDAGSTFIDAEAQIGKNVSILQNNIIKGKTIIYDNCNIKEGNILDNAIILNNSVIEKSNISNSIVGKNCEISPFVNICEKSVIADNCNISSFKNIKNEKINKSI